MVTTAELNRRGLRYAVVVDGAATPASLADLDDKGLPYLVEVADGATMASRRALESRGLRYLVPLAVDATPASKTSLDRQGLRYAVQVDADILPADKATLHRQGLTYYVEVDSSGNSVAVVAAGGAALLTGEANGFATDFLWPVDAERVAVKTSGASVASTVDGFYQNAGTSPKMVYDAAGTLGWSPHNMFIRSEDLTNVTGWGPNNVTAASATRLVETAVTSSHSIPANTTPATIVGAPYCYWVEATAAECDRIMLYGLSLTGQGLGFDLTNGTTFTVTTIPNVGLLSSGMLALGGGRYRCWISVTAGGSTGNGALYMVNGTAFSYAGSTSRGVTIHCQQQNRGTVPLAYLPTTTAARVGLALDYDPVTHVAKGLLCEPAATNLMSRSDDVSFITAEGGTVTLNNQTGPDGALIADTYTENTATFNHGCYGTVGVTTNTDYTFSRFMKMGTRRYSSLGWTDGANGAYAVYDLQTGVVGSSAAIGTGTLNSASIQACPNGWYRCVLSGKFPTGTLGYFTQQAATAATITPDGFGRQSFLGTGATLFMGHLQVEAGTVATSPIPTTSASVTRAGDSISASAASIGYSATAGSWWAETYILDAPSDRRIIGLNTSNIPLYHNNGAIEMFDGTLLFKAVVLLGSVKRSMSAFQSGDRAITSDGLAPATDAGATTNLLNPAIIYVGAGTGGAGMTGYIRKVRYLPRRPSGAEMQAMTV